MLARSVKIARRWRLYNMFDTSNSHKLLKNNLTSSSGSSVTLAVPNCRLRNKDAPLPAEQVLARLSYTCCRPHPPNSKSVTMCLTWTGSNLSIVHSITSENVMARSHACI